MATVSRFELALVRHSRKTLTVSPDLLPLLAGIAALQISLGAPAALATPNIERNVPYRQVAGVTLTLDAYLPSPLGSRRAAIIFVHGGGWRAGDKTSFAPGEPAFAPTALRLAHLGFAVFAINYRLAPGARFPAAASDVSAAVRWVRTRARRFHIDPRRLALFGVSAGGNLAALVAAEGRGSLDRGARVRAAISWSGPMDLSRFDAQLGGPAHHPYVESYLGCPPTRCPDRYTSASPVNQIDPSDPPMLIANSNHEIVPLDQATEMTRTLANAGVAQQLLVVPGSRHAADYEAIAWGPTIRFLSRYLR